MRLSEGKIKAGILHPEQYVRDAAMSYFSSSLSDDRTIMPVAIDAVETYGWADAFADIETLQPLAQSDPTVSWLVGEFNRLSDTQDRRVGVPDFIVLDFGGGGCRPVETPSQGRLGRPAAGCRCKRDDHRKNTIADSRRRHLLERTRGLLSASGERAISRTHFGPHFHLVEAIAQAQRESTDRVLEILLPKGSAANDLSSRWLNWP